jgi:hypothetical protein
MLFFLFLLLFCRLLTGRDGARFQVGVSGTRLQPGGTTNSGSARHALILLLLLLLVADMLVKISTGRLAHAILFNTSFFSFAVFTGC